MKILKCEEFGSPNGLASFVNKNNIQRENILSINYIDTFTTAKSVTLFYYGDSEVEEKGNGFFD